jgi:hypothetical protein
LRDAGELRAAVSLYRRAIELEPARANSHCNLGRALLECSAHRPGCRQLHSGRRADGCKLSIVNSRQLC